MSWFGGLTLRHRSNRKGLLVVPLIDWLTWVVWLGQPELGLQRVSTLNYELVGHNRLSQRPCPLLSSLLQRIGGGRQQETHVSLNSITTPEFGLVSDLLGSCFYCDCNKRANAGTVLLS